MHTFEEIDYRKENLRLPCSVEDEVACEEPGFPRLEGKVNVAAPSGSGYGAPGAAFAKPESPAGRSVHCLAKKSARRFAFLVSDEARSPLSGHASSGMTSFGLEIFASALAFCHQRWLPSISEARSASFCSKCSAFALLLAVVHWLRICLYWVQVWSDLERRAALKSLLFLVHKRRKFGVIQPFFLEWRRTVRVGTKGRMVSRHKSYQTRQATSMVQSLARADLSIEQLSIWLKHLK